MSLAYKMLFRQFQAAGDQLMLGIAIRDLHLSYPLQYQTNVLSCYPEIFYNNPFINKNVKEDKYPVFDLDYGLYLKDLRKKGYHFSDAFIFMLNNLLQINIEKTSMYPNIFLTEEEKNGILEKYNIKKPYWLLTAGIKADIPLKAYPPSMYQAVIDILKERQFDCDIIQIGSDKHIHPSFRNGIIDFVGKTDDLRDLFALMYHAEGSIGPVSLHMHLAAAFQKPCVVIAGGREEASWEQYSIHKYLNTIGRLNCCEKDGCWKSQLSDCSTLNTDKGRFPKCMTMIEPEQIVNEIIKFRCEKFV